MQKCVVGFGETQMRMNGSPWMRSRRGRSGVAALLVLAGLSSAAPSSRMDAGVTDPALVLTNARVEAGAATRVLVLRGEIPSEDLVQARLQAYVLVRETTTGTGYVLFELGGRTAFGNDVALADGVSPAEAAGLIGSGTPVQGEVLFLGMDRLDLSLPPEFANGPAEVLVFAAEAQSAVLSNAIPLGASQ